MQIPKIAFVICALALATTGESAPDNSDQAAARAALVAKLFDLSADAATTNSYTRQPGNPAPAARTPPMADPAFTTTTVVKPAIKLDNGVMHPVTKMAAPVYLPSPAEADSNFRILHTPRMEVQNPPMNWTKNSGTTFTAPAAKPVVRPKTTDGAYTLKHSTGVSQPTVKAGSEFAPVVAPALPLASAKQQQLLDLLSKYKADQISPEEYHRQRAVIMNGM